MSVRPRINFPEGGRMCNFVVRKTGNRRPYQTLTPTYLVGSEKNIFSNVTYAKKWMDEKAGFAW